MNVICPSAPLLPGSRLVIRPSLYDPYRRDHWEWVGVRGHLLFGFRTGIRYGDTAMPTHRPSLSPAR
jgi:hypothetical protein